MSKEATVEADKGDHLEFLSPAEIVSAASSLLENQDSEKGKTMNLPVNLNLSSPVLR